MPRAGEGAVVRQGHLIAVVRIFLIGCVVLLVVGCAGTSSETSNKKEQGRSPEATASEEEARCEGTRSYHIYFVQYRRGGQGPLKTGSEEDMKKTLKKARQKGKKEKWWYGANTYDFGVYTTTDLPGCPKGGLLKGTDKPDKLEGGLGSDILYGGDGDDTLDQWSSEGEDVIYGGDGNDWLGGDSRDGQDKLYCGKGKDVYAADKNNYVDSSCEKKEVGGGA